MPSRGRYPKHKPRYDRDGPPPRNQVLVPITKTPPIQGRSEVIRDVYDPSQLRSIQVHFIHITGSALPKAYLYYNVFKHLGEISSINIDTSNGPSSKTAIRVTFSPPPTRRFWPHDNFPCTQSLQRGAKTLLRFRVRLLDVNPISTVPSPIKAGVFYSSVLTAPFQDLTFGLSPSPGTMYVVETLGSDHGEPMQLRLELKGRPRLEIEFSIQDGTHYADPVKAYTQKYILFKIEIQLSRIKTVYHATGEYILLSLDDPPQYFERSQDPVADSVDSSTYWSSRSLWIRMTHLPIASDTDELFPTGPVRLYDQGAGGINLGELTTFRVDLSTYSQAQKAIFDQILNAMSDHNITINTEDRFHFEEPTEEQLNVFHSIDLSSSLKNGLSNEIDIARDGLLLPFGVRYQLDVCLSSKVFNRYHLTEEFISRLYNLPEFQAQDILEKAYYSERRFVNPLDIFSEFRPRLNPPKLPKHCHFSRSISVTPTTVRIFPATVEISNRVIRQYSHLGDSFIRLRFTDEKGYYSLIRDNSEKGKQVYERVRRALNHGVAVGHYVFEFLAWGSSQLREHATYCFRPTSGVTAASIRAWMGDFSNILNVAKHASRLSLAFSTTRPFQGFSVSNTEIPDYEGHGYCFSDGVGKMSVLLAQMVGNALGLPDSLNDPPSAIQFRYGGHKGVLAIDPTLPRYSQICTRPSQNKFKFTGKPTVEVTRTSSFARARLNRQLITILSALGVADSVFRDRMTSHMKRLSDALYDKDEAIDLLRKTIDYNQTTVSLANIIEDGFMESNEPFLVGCLHLWRAWELKFLKDKAHIPIEQSAFVLGCVDETGKLQGHENKKLNQSFNNKKEEIDALPQIFLKVGLPYREGAAAEYQVIKGPCIIARNPALHPGDIRVVNAVDVPELHHLKNVVVLPQSGDRPISHMCAGGDLDGDDYLVIWDPEFIFSEWNVEPMSYEAATPLNPQQPVEVTDTVEFFIHYMQKDSLAQIALAHLAHSDIQPLGVRSKICLRLAQLHSDAVDFAKSGVPADFRHADQPRHFPHFMERKGRETRRSTKILGQLFDMVERVDFNLRLLSRFNNNIAKVWKVSMPPEDWEKLKIEARKLKALYDADIKRVQRQFSIKTELEVWTVFCMEHTTEKGSYKFTEELGRITQNHKQHYRSLVFEAVGVKPDEPDYGILGPFIAAMYEATAESAAGGNNKKDTVPSPLVKKETNVQEAPRDSNDPTDEGSDSNSLDENAEPVQTSHEKQQQQEKAPPDALSLGTYISFPWIFSPELGAMAKFSSSMQTVNAIEMASQTGIQPIELRESLVTLLKNLRTRTRVLGKSALRSGFQQSRFSKGLYSSSTSRLNSPALPLSSSSSSVSEIESLEQPPTVVSESSRTPPVIVEELDTALEVAPIAPQLSSVVEIKEQGEANFSQPSVPVAGLWSYPGADEEEDQEVESFDFSKGASLSDIYTRLGRA